jgi:hypothetical protein
MLASGTKGNSFGTSGLSTPANELEVNMGEFVLSLSNFITTQTTYYPLYSAGENVCNSNPMGVLSLFQLPSHCCNQLGLYVEINGGQGEKHTLIGCSESHTTCN